MLAGSLTWASIVALPLAAVLGQCINHTASSLEQLYRPWLSPGTQIATLQDPDFSSVVASRWSTWEAPHWCAAIKPASVIDLQEVVRISVANGIPFIATNSGHGPKEGQGRYRGLNVNLAGFDTVHLQLADDTVTVAAGVRDWAVQKTLYDAGKELQTGNAACPSVIGLTIGAGIGMMTGMHGLMVDAVQSVRMVTATGALVTASHTENPDLFWAVRGAGVNFGVVTEATFRVHEQTNEGNVTAATFIYTAPSNRSLWELLQTFDGNQPAKLSFQAIIQFDRPSDSPRIVVQLWYFGPVADAQPYLNLFNGAGSVSTSVQYIPQTDLYYQSVTSGVCDEGSNISAHTLGFSRTDIGSFERHFADMVAFYRATSDFQGISVMQYYSNEMTLQTPASETAFPWRDVQIWWLTQNEYTDQTIGPRVDEFMEGQRSNLQATSGFATPHVYFNYAHGDEGPEAWYSADNLPRLRDLKAKWDPKGVFGNGAPLYQANGIAKRARQGK